MKKVLSIFLTFSLLVQFVCITTNVCAASSTIVSFKDIQGNRGDVLSFDITISAASNVQACGLELSYNEKVIEIISVEKGTALTASPIINISKLGKVVFSYASTTPITRSGSLMRVTIKIKGDAQYGVSHLKLAIYDFSDRNFEQIPHVINEGKLTVIAPALDCPSNISVVSIGESYANLLWDYVESATGFNVYINGEKANEQPIKENTFYLEGLLHNTQYEVQVSTLNYSTESEKSTAFRFTTNKARYLVLFVDWNYSEEHFEQNSILKLETVEYGFSATPPEEPKRNGYVFTGWSADYSCINSDKVFYAMYERSTYTVRFLNYDGTVLKNELVEVGASATSPTNPSKIGYVFKGWNKEFSNVQSDLDVTAMFEECTHNYDEWKSDNNQTHSRHCLECGYVDTQNHMFVSSIVSPSSTEQGYTLHECSCGYSYKDNYTETISENAPQIVLESKKAVAGKTFNVNIVVKNNPGIASATLRVKYNTDVMILTNVSDAGNFGSQVHKPEHTSPYTLAWANDTIRNNITFNGTIATLTFEVIDGVQIGDYPIELSYDYNNSDIYDVNGRSVLFTTVNGVISVIDAIIGDVDGNGIVNNLDRMVLTRYLANWSEYPAESINMVAADVNGDGLVNNLDRMVLTRHLANWENYEDLPYAG